MKRAFVLAAALIVAGCQSSGASSAPPLTRPSAALPDACSLVGGDDLQQVLGGEPAPAASDLAHADVLYGHTCEWGQATGPSGAVGIQVGTADATGHDMVLNRSLVLSPTLVSSVAPGAYSCMNIAVLPDGGMTGASVFFQVDRLSVLLAVSGPQGNLATAERLARHVLANLTS